MKRLIFCIVLLLSCIFLSVAGQAIIVIGLENKTNDEIIVNVEVHPDHSYSAYFLLEPSEKILSVRTYARSLSNRHILSGEWDNIVSLVRSYELLTVSPLEIFNTVFFHYVLQI